jgi:hypothetical protein
MYEGGIFMRRIAAVVFLIVIAVVPLCAKTYSEIYPMSCSALWPAVKETVRNSGDYGVVFIDGAEMIASFSIGASGNGVFRIETAVLNVKSDSSCELKVEPLAQPVFANDGADFKKRLDTALADLKTSQNSSAKRGDDAK